MQWPVIHNDGFQMSTNCRHLNLGLQLNELNSYMGTICPPVEMTAADGKPKKLMLARICNPCDHIIKQRTDCKSARAILFKNILV